MRTWMSLGALCIAMFGVVPAGRAQAAAWPATGVTVLEAQDDGLVARAGAAVGLGLVDWWREHRLEVQEAAKCFAIGGGSARILVTLAGGALGVIAALAAGLACL